MTRTTAPARDRDGPPGQGQGAGHLHQTKSHILGRLLLRCITLVGVPKHVPHLLEDPPAVCVVDDGDAPGVVLHKHLFTYLLAYLRCSKKASREGLWSECVIRFS